MPKYLVPFCLFLLLVKPAITQHLPTGFGYVSKEELVMERHPIDTSASAIILFDTGEAIVNNNSTIGTTINRHIRIKLFKKNSFDDWGTMKFWVPKGGMPQLKAATYNLVNGEIVSHEIPSSGIFKSKFKKKYEEISVAFQNLQEGCVIELAYKQIAEDLYLPAWQFQQSIPILWSEYSLSSPVKEFTPHISGSIAVSNHEIKYDGKYQRWLFQDVPAFKSELLMPDKNVYLSTIRFVAQHRSWLDVYQYYYAATVPILERQHFLEDKVTEITAGITDPKIKIRVLSDFLKNEIQWTGENDIYAEESKVVLKRKRGTAADINLMFASMLKKAGFVVDLVLLSTRDNGFVTEELPSLSNFNYVVCQINIDNQDLLLDATDKFLPYDVLPEKCFNHKGFLVSNGQYGWVGVEPTKREKVIINANVVVTAIGQVEGTVNITIADYAAFNFRKNLNESDTDAVKKSYIEQGWGAKNIQVKKSPRVEDPIIVEYQLNPTDHAVVSNDLIYFNPFLFLKEETNPFTNDDRTYPIDFGKITERVLVCNITLPENYEVEELPESKILVLPDNAAKCSFNISHIGNQILVTSRLQINKTLFQPEEYPNLKEFYSRLIAKKNESIVLKKK